MRVIYGIGRRPDLPSGIVAAIGVFDGVHCGHQKLIAHTVREARAVAAQSLVLTFHPHPVAVLYPDRFHGYLMPLSRRLEGLAALGVDICLVVRFTKAFARMSPQAFIDRYLVRELNIRTLLVGEDFHFGRDRAGSIALLDVAGARRGFSVIPEHLLNRSRTGVKSSRIRREISAGRLGAAAELLGRPYSLEGKVVRGEGRGRKLGYPTANIQTGDVIIPPPGIYMARTLIGQDAWNSLVYIGYKPSFKKAPGRPVVEVHILDFKRNLYGSCILVDILRLLRKDRRFPDAESLVAQIRRDEVKARKWFLRH